MFWDFFWKWILKLLYIFGLSYEENDPKLKVSKLRSSFDKQLEEEMDSIDCIVINFKHESEIYKLISTLKELERYCNEEGNNMLIK
jgi:hypothetical protein